MKNKKLLLPVIILVVAILAIAVYSVCSSIAKKPTVTEGEFPFTITYELDGNEVTVSDVYTARYTGNDGYADTKSRVYVGEIGNMGEENTVYTIKQEGNTRIVLHTNFYADYMMGDTDADYFDFGSFAPQILYYDAEETEYADEETLLAQGVKLISYEYPIPVENNLVFSHISHFSGQVVFPTVLIALVALAAMLVFVKKEKQTERKNTDVISTILNFVICFTVLPFVSIVGMFIDINGGSPDLSFQIMYFIPAFTALAVAASVALRRNGYGVKSLVAQLCGPAVFAVYLIVCGILGLL